MTTEITTTETIPASIALWESKLIADANALIATTALLTIELCADGTKKGYEAVHEAYMSLVKFRTGADATREDVKRPIIDMGKRIEATFKAGVAITAPEEARLKTLKTEYEAEEKRAKEAKEQARKALLAERYQKLATWGSKLNPVDMFEATEKQWADILEKAEADYIARIESERIEAENVAKLKAEADRIESERLAKIEADRIEAARLAKIESDKAEAERIEANRIDREAREEKQRLQDIENARVAKELSEQKAIADARDAEQRKESDRLAKELAESKRVIAERQAELDRKEAELIAQAKPIVETYSERDRASKVMEAKHIEDWKIRIIDVVMEMGHINDNSEVTRITNAIHDLLSI